MRVSRLALFVAIIVLGVIAVSAQETRPKSPRGEAATQIKKHWITVDYGRPILRGRRDIFGSGETYGQGVSGRGPVWRVGANKSTRFRTEVDLMFGDKMLPAGEYSMFIELKESGWTLIFSNHKAKNSGREPGEGIWGAYGYNPEMDVIRVPMKVGKTGSSVDQLTIAFLDVTEKGGSMALYWDDVQASAGFTVRADRIE